MRLSVVVPCFNEEGNVARVVEQAARVGRRMASELEIIVVDDGSTDDTGQVLTALAELVPELAVVSHTRNRGYGAAVRAGLDQATLDYVFLTDGDGQFDLEELPSALRLLAEHDVIAGYRTNRSDGWWRHLWGRAWTALVNQAFGLQVRDANCAFKLFPQSLLRSTKLRSEGAMISAELLLEARRFDLRVGEYAVSHYPRRSGRQTGASLPVVAVALAELLACLPRRARTPGAARYAP
jgi:glycosyltransferase involved in cell wall biosynthesis